MPKPYFTGILASEDESKQKWTKKVDLEAKKTFKTLSEAEIRRRQAICEQELAKLAQKPATEAWEAVGCDVLRKQAALDREMFSRC